MRQLTSQETSGIVAAFGVGLAGAAMTSNAEAAIIPIVFTPGTVPYVGAFGYGDIVHLGPGSFAFFQYNDDFGKTLFTSHNAGNLGLVGFTAAQASQTITISQDFNPGYNAGFSAGIRTFGFRTTGSLLGWIRVDFGGAGGTITYLAGAYNDSPRESIHVGATEDVPEPTSLALAALSALALGSRSVRRLREKRKAS